MEYPITFIDREEELQALDWEYRRPAASFVVLYGRRRIGKTALIREFLKDKEAVYFLATEESEDQNRDMLKNLIAGFTGNPLLEGASVKDWTLIFKALADFERPAKKILVIDEFQYLGKINPAFPSIMQKIWDTLLLNRDIMVILCGSLISMMESQTLAYTSPLYGRRTAQIKLRQIPFWYYGQFFQGKSREELVKLYALTGGVPRYIELFRSPGDIFGAIRKNILSRTSFLYDEPNFLLLRELGQVGTYFSIIKTIAAGNHKMGDIAANLGVKQTGLTKYLTTLINLDILEREVPVTETQPEKSKRGLYRIKDNFILFWFKFVYPALSYLESGNEAPVMDRIRANFIDGHVSYVYEAICREEFFYRNAPPFRYNKLGRWWNKNHEIDMVALNTEGQDILFGECKFRKSKTGINVFFELLEKARKVDWKQGERREQYALFSISGFTEELIALAKTREDLLLYQ
ncbi:ATP-binding protein [Treponema primitia]|uniref:ATP-binding protein n=1 Tax=Treponema primitia TaxID=88058 RepID=UPI0002555894|nr:ATP-binding protein [Treponema primitia]